MKRKKTIDSLYYITHLDNVPSILKKGVLSHAIIEQENIQPTPVYDKQIVANRSSKNTPDGKSLWEYANFYFQPRNPMLYRDNFLPRNSYFHKLELYSMKSWWVKNFTLVPLVIAMCSPQRLLCSLAEFHNQY